MDNNFQELIWDYLSNSLDPETKQAFEQQLAVDPDFAARVALEREVADAIGASPEHELRANLGRISKQFPTPESLGIQAEKSAGWRSERRWQIIGGLVIIVGLFLGNLKQIEKALGFGAENAASPMTLPQAKPTEPTPVLENPSSAEPKANDSKAHEFKDSQTPAQSEPIAGAFTPIAQLEAAIGTQVRSGELRFLISEPRHGVTLTRLDGKTKFSLSGKLEGRSKIFNIVYSALIFNNNKQRFETMRALENQALDIAPNGNFHWEKNLNLAPGLYYLLIEDRESGEWMFVDKFTVK
jgi:hypothetical protein